MSVRRIIVLGSTGSVGTQTLEVAAAMPQRLSVTGLAAYASWELVAEQCRRFAPEVVAMADEDAARRLQQACPDTEVLAGAEGVRTAAAAAADVVVNAIVGVAGLEPTLAALEAGRTLALANKESLVAAGPLAAAAAGDGGRLVPVDSEHNAIFQCLKGIEADQVGRLVLTASGGPFRGWTREELAGVGPEDAVRHPRWEMGRKISVDSATLMNKGLEVIEAQYLFDVPAAAIEVVVHPQAVVHSLVETVDGAMLAHMGAPDMRHPIQTALSHPDRWQHHWDRLDLVDCGPLQFERPDTDTFPCLKYGFRAARIGGTMPAALNAANEIAVGAFLRGDLPFLAISNVNRTVMDRHRPVRPDRPGDVLAADRWARRQAQQLIREHDRG